MLKEVVKIFEKEYRAESREDNQDFYITKDHIPEDGDYIILEETRDGFQELDRINVKVDKKTRTVETTNSYFKFIQYADYLSKYLESNKAIADKNIHSNNYLTLFIKKENLFNGKITEDVLTKYYETFKNPYTKYCKKQLKIAYAALEDKYGKPDIDRINKIEEWVKKNLFSLKLSKDKTYVKLFFFYDLEEYRKESEKYILTNIYNNAKYNTKIKGIIYGVPNNNMGLNSKKPYLEHKTRKNVAPILLNQDEVLLQKKFFDYLNTLVQQRKINLYIDEEGIYALTGQDIPKQNFTGYFMRLQKGMETEIHDFDTVVNFSNHITPIEIKNELRLEKSDIEYKTIHTRAELKKIINEVFFRKFLETNYFTDAKDMKIYDDCIRRNILLARRILFDWFYKGINNSLWNTLEFCCLDLIKNSIVNNYLPTAKDQFNLYTSLKIYFEGEEKMEKTKINVEEFEKKLDLDKPGEFSNDGEYYFAAGQLANYFLTKSKANVKKYSLMNPILNAKSPEKIELELKKLYDKYNHDIISNRRFNNMYYMVNDYIVSNNIIDNNNLLKGFLHPCMIFKSTNTKTNEN